MVAPITELTIVYIHISIWLHKVPTFQKSCSGVLNKPHFVLVVSNDFNNPAYNCIGHVEISGSTCHCNAILSTRGDAAMVSKYPGVNVDWKSIVKTSVRMSGENF